MTIHSNESLLEVNEPVLSPQEETIFEDYRERYVNALPDRLVKKVIDKERDITRIIKPAIEYSEEDVRYLKTREAKFVDQTSRGILLEKILFIQAKWWGDSVEILRASRFDDVANGVDLIVNFLNDQNESLGLLAIDVTVSNADILGYKQRDIQDKLGTGKLSTLRYGPTKSGDMHGRKFKLHTHVPLIDITLSPEILEQFCKDLVEVNGAQLPEHPVGQIIIDSVLAQLKRQIRIIEELEILSQEQKEFAIQRIEAILKLVEATDKEKAPTRSGVWKDRMAEYLIDDKLNEQISPRRKLG